MSNLNIQKDIPLADLTTFKIGGNARFFIQARNKDEMLEALKFAEEDKLEVFILGGGSNVLISDEGFEGLVLQIASKGISIFQEKDKTIYVKAEAGEDWDEFVEFCVDKNLAGIECLSGIPGLIGGTPIQNVGAYGQDVSETIVSVDVFDRFSKEQKTLTNAECGFEYRKSIFNTTEKNRYVVLSVTYALKLDGEPKIVYADLIKHFADRQPNLKETRQVVKQIRKEKGMLVRQGGLDAQSAGSFFKNPIITKEHFEEIKETAKSLGEKEVPSYEIDKKTLKIPAAWLIEKSGFPKGFTKGNAGISTKHSLALTNRGNSTAKEILELKEEIQQKVLKIFKVHLHPEPNFIGF